jgi:hypothetical protein
MVKPDQALDIFLCLFLLVLIVVVPPIGSMALLEPSQRSVPYLFLHMSR